MSTLRNFHVPLPEEIYQQLRAETRRQNKPATQLARLAIESWLKQQQESALNDEIRRYAEQMAGTPADLDSALEAATIEHLLQDDAI